MEGAGLAAIGEVPGAEGLAERGVFGKPVAGMENPRLPSPSVSIATAGPGRSRANW